MSTVRLSATQRQVVDFGEGALAVIAGPGSGKTRVLTERIRRLLTQVPGHFRVLALTFTNKAAKEMTDRLGDLAEARKRAFIGTLHGFCLDVLADRGKHIGLATMPQIFEQYQDRKQILAQAVSEDAMLCSEISHLSTKEQAQRLDDWLRSVGHIKTHPITTAVSGIDDPIIERVYEGYNAGLQACGACDFDDLLLYTYRLFSEFPQVADLYRRVYGYVCVDEAQDLNEAQYAVIRAMAGDSLRNIMMVGDPNQSIYGFNTSSPKYLTDDFKADFNAAQICLEENYRSSRAVVRVAQSLDPTYTVAGQLAVEGYARKMVGDSEANEASRVVDELTRLMAAGHPDIEGPITPTSFAILGRTRYTLIGVERQLKERGLPYFKRLSVTHENESDLADEFQLALRVLSNPKDAVHLSALRKRWNLPGPVTAPADAAQVVQMVQSMSTATQGPGCVAIADALAAVHATTARRLDFMPAFKVLEAHADKLDEPDRRAIREDVAVLREEWDHFLRSEGSRARTLQSFLSNIALGTSGQATRDGVALLTVHSSKGLEFDVVFVVGMADGVFPDYRATTKKQKDEERRNAFVAVTRSKRLLYLSYPRQRLMPWGDVWQGAPSPYITAAPLQRP
ncbi:MULTISPECIES: ATP-dependent helicase [Comamonadaceae]|uniref:DNA 3'-5' helicase n=2 Tax=Pseudomonadota TaxID=1224 RepID=A0A1H3SS20_9BURK|nr:ATP-dependent helicase [Delftia lacustris]SDZ40816.1 DNA helicase-2 / ATP-dependent DNA helicase PcrA [Delftia lacustris]